MKRSLHIFALILSFALILAFFQISQHLPGNSGALVEKKYNSWSGVLRAWVCSNWRCNGSFISWLNRCASAFEKEHPGIYIEFTAVSQQSMNNVHQLGLRPPELLFCSPGILDNPSVLVDLPDGSASVIQSNNAIPVCMGAYAWVINTALCDTVPGVSILLPDDAGRSFSRAAEGLVGTAPDIELHDPGIDLGLTASAAANATFDTFINGELPALIVSQYELSKLIRLRDAGKGPDWRCISSGKFVYADQLLLGGIVSQHDESGVERMRISRAFLQFLLADDCQRQLTSIGAFPSTGIPIYPASSSYSAMESMLLNLPIVTPELF